MKVEKSYKLFNRLFLYSVRRQMPQQHTYTDVLICLMLMIFRDQKLNSSQKYMAFKNSQYFIIENCAVNVRDHKKQTLYKD